MASIELIGIFPQKWKRKLNLLVVEHLQGIVRILIIRIIRILLLGLLHKKRWEELIEEVKQQKNEWVASSETFKEIESLLDLIDRVFADESECAFHRLECKKAIFNRAVSKLYEKEHA